MAERRAVNKWYPSSWEPSMGSINAAQGTHPLRERARKLHLGILIIRFELPFNVVCTRCDHRMGRGVRFNAEKKTVGHHYSTPVLSFRMRCPQCSGTFELRTDPHAGEYVVVEGARRKVEAWTPEPGEAVVRASAEEHAQRTTNAFCRLEHEMKDAQRAQDAMPRLTQLQQDNARHWQDPYAASQRVRAKFRAKKHAQQRQARTDQAFLDKHALDVPLQPEQPEDAAQAAMLDWTGQLQNRARQRKRAVQQAPMLAPIRGPSGRARRLASSLVSIPASSLARPSVVAVRVRRAQPLVAYDSAGDSG